MSHAQNSFASVSVHVGDDWDLRCDTYPQTTPILTIGGGSTQAHFCIAGRERITAEAVAFARELARQAARFAAECERLHAGQSGQGHSQVPAETADNAA